MFIESIETILAIIRWYTVITCNTGYTYIHNLGKKIIYFAVSLKIQQRGRTINAFIMCFPPILLPSLVHFNYK